VSEFEDFVNGALAEQEAERKRESDAYQEKINREINAARDSMQALLDAFATDKRFGNYFKPPDNPQGQIHGQRFEFTMSSKAIMLHFAGNVYDSDQDPTGLGISIKMKVYDSQSTQPSAGVDYPIRCDILSGGACVLVDLYGTVVAATAALIKA
jgi:hypothetical protein